jgi:hypothetical protein
MSAFSQLFRSRYVFLALVAYGAFSVLIQTFGITPQRANVNIFDEHMIDGSMSMRKHAVPLPPGKVFREWQYYHSVQAIQRNPHNRTFIVGGCSCPRQAGNILHEFLSALLQAVATNRNLILKHHRSPYWEKMGENSEEACHRILQRGFWIPLYTE